MSFVAILRKNSICKLASGLPMSREETDFYSPSCSKTSAQSQINECWLGGIPSLQFFKKLYPDPNS